ncbi:DUF2681 domain-containing protein [Gallibacterium anatis]|uniref:DUF2681 domain-containing protein n=1 Tax=Gallibacterium anatis TaxID=750 RepID=UPI00254CAE05|nr:DUF2681 domain-containing protein [Gallibacterium anatis]WIM82564.1 DUF2681 domain-containing protein [Gallibacterium anatis]
MIFYLILGFSALVLLGAGVAYYKIRKAGQEIDRLFKENHELQNQKAVAETQVKHFETRKKNEENSRNTDRTALLDRLQQQGDLRD